MMTPKDWFALPRAYDPRHCRAMTYLGEVVGDYEMPPAQMVKEICPYSGCIHQERCGVIKQEEMKDGVSRLPGET